jgi:hypothetical protein
MEEEVACTLSPTRSLKTTHSESQEEHPNREPNRHTHQQARTPPSQGQKDSPGSVYPDVKYI